MRERTEYRSERVALVTGASRGLGEAFSEMLARQGFHVVATARTEGALAALSDRINNSGRQSTAIAADITSRDQMQQLCRAIYDRWRKLDLFVHAAVHAPPLSPVVHGEIADVKKAVEVNCTATWELITYVAPLLLLARPAAAVFFEDDRAGQKFFGGYGSSKAFQIAVVRSWQREITSRSELRVEIMKPKPMATESRRRFFPGEDRSLLATPESEAIRLYGLLRRTGSELSFPDGDKD